MTNQLQNMQDLINDAISDALKKRGMANILIAGKTGVGKSTLINAIFNGRMAETGQGRPVTQETRKITKEGVPVSIYDTKGLELADYKPILESLQKLIKDKNSSTDHHEHIHIAWLCINEGSRRVEEAEVELVEKLGEIVPVIVVITNAVSDNGFKKQVESLLPKAKAIMRVNSLPQQFDNGEIIPAKGLVDLVEITMEVIPEGQKNAFAAAQRVSLEQNVKRAHVVVASFATTAGLAAATPIPFADAAVIVPIQIGMLASISACFGMEISKGYLATIMSSTFVALAGTMTGRAIVGAILKLIPGGGSVAGGAISAGVATTLTVTFGKAYIETIKSLLIDDPNRQLSAEEVAKAFKEKMGK